MSAHTPEEVYQVDRAIAAALEFAYRHGWKEGRKSLGSTKTGDWWPGAKEDVYVTYRRLMDAAPHA